LGKSKLRKYNRILLKLSGEAINGSDSVFNFKAVSEIANEIKQVYDLGIEIGIVIGGGNIVRGNELSKIGFSRSKSDYIGMLSTIINGILFEDVLHTIGVKTVLQSALVVDTVTETIILEKTKEYIKNKSVVIFAGGTGSPYFTTDTAAALRACEINADILMKATKVDGVFDKDPEIHNDAKFYKRLSYTDVLKEDLKVMDASAVSMCRDQKIPIIVFNIHKRDSIRKIIEGENVGTVIG